jgi:rod shape-determining protein MreC
VIDKGLKHGVQPGSAVIDDSGVLGQVTRVHPLLSEVTLLIDRNQAIPVLNARTGVRGVAYGQSTPTGEGLELRYTLSNADINEGDLLTTSGVDGVYPPGLAVARISTVERRAESTFTRILCQPLARMGGALHVLVLEPVSVEPRAAAPTNGTPVIQRSAP